MRVFINGKECAMGPSGELSSKDPTSEQVHIGTWQRDGEVGKKFKGMMRELRVWSKTLSTKSILGLMCRTADPQAEGLVAYWPLEGGEERYVVDKASGHNHGVLVGNASWVRFHPVASPAGSDSNLPSGCEVRRRSSSNMSSAAHEMVSNLEQSFEKVATKDIEGGMRRILVTGGAGYIGSHVCIELLALGYMVSVVDNYDNSSAESLRRVCSIAGKPLSYHRVDLLDELGLESIFDGPSFDAVMHLAGLKSVSKSVSDPLHYYQNNISGTLNLLRMMRKYECKNLIFSSSATVYGDASTPPFKEEDPVGVGITNPYGQTKFMIERILQDLAVSDPEWNIIMLRYFNPVGAHPSGLIGEDPNGPPNNLLPFITQVAVGKRPFLAVFGSDYDTPDGTGTLLTTKSRRAKKTMLTPTQFIGVRDFIHVVDLAKGHVASLRKLADKPGIKVYNLGTGCGYSVLEVLRAVEKACGHEIPHQIKPRREGDIGAAFACATKAQHELAWEAQLGIEAIAEDAWRWQQMNPAGFGGLDKTC